MGIRTLSLGALVVVASFVVATLVMNALWPEAIPQQAAPSSAAPAQELALPPLRPVTGRSTMLVPAVIALPVLRALLEARTPRDFSGKARNPVAKLLSHADLSFTVTRGPIGLAGRPDALVVTTPLAGSFRVRGVMTDKAHALGGAIGNLLGGRLGRQVESLAGKTFEQHADISGNVTTTVRPAIGSNWRVAPNLAAQIDVADVALPIGGTTISVAGEVKPLLERAVRRQTDDLEARLRNDPFLENAARSEWAKLCRAIPLAPAGERMPALWLEVRPVRAIAAQPRIDAKAATLFVGVEAQTRIVPNETRPECPFPERLDLVPQANDGTISIAVPIDIPFVDASRLLAAQLEGQTFPQDGSGAFVTTIKSASLAPSGSGLLISLRVHVKKRGWFGLFGADAAVTLRGRPVLDRDRQILRFADVALDVQSDAAPGLVGTALQAAVPMLQNALADHAAIDLRPLADDARKRIAAAVAAFAEKNPGISATLAIDDLRLAGIAYDDSTLRVIANAEGRVNVTVDALEP